MDTLMLSPFFAEESSNLRTSISVESLPKLLRKESANGLTFDPIGRTSVRVQPSHRSDSLSDIRGQSSSPLATNLHYVGKELFFPVSGLTMDSFCSKPTQRNTSPGKSSHLTPLSQQRSPKKAPPSPPPPNYGRKVCVNGREIALFQFGDQFYAVDEKCPHMGGPIHLGDIEDVVSSVTGQPSPCVICPWHKWCFELATGRQISPPGRERHVQSYPVRVDPTNGRIFIGFASIEPSIFTDCDF